MDYYVFSDHGEILRTGSCIPAAFKFQAMNPGEHLAEGYANPLVHQVVAGQLVEMSRERQEARRSQPLHKSRWDHQTGTWADLRTPEERRLWYREERARAYPPIGDQLDALWKGGADAAAMRAQIQAVKDRFPKPA